MKIGLVLECGKDGPDQKVLEPLVKKLAPRPNEVTSRTLNNKPRLLSGCGAVASQLLKDQYDRVLVIWDLWPAWATDAPCRKEHRDEAMESLTEAGVDLRKVRLLCIEQMLESWLLADPRALERLVTKWMQPRRPRNFRVGPEAVFDTKPKGLLTRLFREHGCRPYYDLNHAHQIAAQWDEQSLRRLADLPTFQRFMKCLLR
jgi:hypothetical protein